MKNRGKKNLNYKDGFLLEHKNFNLLKEQFKHILGATQIEETTRCIIDLATGIDAYATIQGSIYGISLRVRESNWNSFTLNRHITDPNSEIHKWIKNRSNKIKPAYHIQANKINTNNVNLIRINIDAFANYLKYLINNDKLEDYYNDKLLAYEFKKEHLANHTFIFNANYKF